MVGAGVRYLSRLVKMTVSRGGKMPLIKKGVEAVTAGPMSRREFFGRSKDIGKEAIAQGEMLSARSAMEANQKKGMYWLRKNSEDVHKLKKIQLENEKTVGKFAKKRQKEINRQAKKENYLEEGPTPSSMAQWDLDDAKIALRTKLNDTARKKAGLSAERVKKIGKMQGTARQGYDDIRDPVLDKWFNARDKWMKATGEGTTRASQWGPGRLQEQAGTSRADRVLMEGPRSYAHRKSLRPEKREEQLYPKQTHREYWTDRWGDIDTMQVGKDFVNEGTKEVKRSASKIKSIWKGLKEEFDKGLHSVD